VKIILELYFDPSRADSQSGSQHMQPREIRHETRIFPMAISLGWVPVEIDRQKGVCK
jgi:hypothetical protein